MAGKEMRYQSTRGGAKDVTFEDVVFSSYAPDGGLFVPQTVPIIDFATLQSFCGSTYEELSAKIFSYYVSDKIRPHLKEICKKAFQHFDFQKSLNGESTPVPLRKVGPVYILEPIHGPTLAFKDVGLNILAQLMDHILVERNARCADPSKAVKANVLVETSGDTGPAAVAAVILNTSLVNIFTMFPRKQVSPIQARQLTTVKSRYAASPNVKNVVIYATDKSSDDQCLVMKRIFGDAAFVARYNVCAMNSINFVRIVAQTTYYYWAYVQLFEGALRRLGGDATLPRMDVAIPSGAFGNGVSACFAKAMGLPVRYILPSTNANDIVHRTLMRGDFSSDVRDYHWTFSPAMDVQVPYNLERFFYLALNQDTALIAEVMRQFEGGARSGRFAYRFGAVHRACFARFIQVAYKTEDSAIGHALERMLEEHDYLPCPHTACGLHAGLDFVEKSARIAGGPGAVPMVCVATAHPSKFPEIIDRAMYDERDNRNKGKDGSERKKADKYRRWFSHPFLPKPDDEEEFTLLPNGKDWDEQWIEIVKNDVRRLNSRATRSKL